MSECFDGSSINIHDLSFHRATSECFEVFSFDGVSAESFSFVGVTSKRFKGFTSGSFSFDGAAFKCFEGFSFRFDDATAGCFSFDGITSVRTHPQQPAFDAHHQRPAFGCFTSGYFSFDVAPFQRFKGSSFRFDGITAECFGLDGITPAQTHPQ